MRSFAIIAVILAGILFTHAGHKKQSSQLVYVEWTDIVATDTGWRSREDLDSWIEGEEGLVHQTGFIYKETDTYIVLVDSYFDDTTIGAAIRIPKGVIKKIEKR